MDMRPRNALEEYFATHPAMSKRRFSRIIGVTPSYVSQLTSPDPPWPGREIARRIGEATGGVVTPNDLAGYTPEDA